MKSRSFGTTDVLARAFVSRENEELEKEKEMELKKENENKNEYEDVQWKICVLFAEPAKTERGSGCHENTVEIGKSQRSAKLVLPFPYRCYFFTLARFGVLRQGPLDFVILWA